LAGFFGHGPAAPDGARHGLGLRSTDDGGAKAAHEDAFFLSKAFGHEEDNLVTAMNADQGEAHTGIAGRGLYDGCAGLEETPPLGIQDHTQGCAVFDTAARIEELEFYVDIGCPGRDKPVEMEHGGGPHQLRHIFGNQQRAGGDFTGQGHRLTERSHPGAKSFVFRRRSKSAKKNTQGREWVLDHFPCALLLL
jgi:hypothetical protein